MNLRELIQRVRQLGDDLEKPYLWSDEVIRDRLNDAQDEAAIRGRLLRVTAESHPTLCEIDVSAGEAAHALHPSLYEISHQSWRRAGETRREPLRLVSREWIDAAIPDWRNLDPAPPAFLVRDESMVQLVPAPDGAGALLLEGYRVPLSPMVADDDEPEIARVHHIHLCQWVLYVGYSVPDAELLNPGAAAAAEAEFRRYFGARPDSDLRRSTRDDETQHIEAYWP